LAAGLARQMIEMRPGRLGVDMVGGYRRDAAPIVDAGRDQFTSLLATQVRRCLDRHLGAEDQPGDGDRPLELGQVRFRGIGHAGVGLGAKVLNNDLLDVAVGVVQVAQRQQRVDPLGPGLANPNQDAAGEGHMLASGLGDGGEASRRVLIW